MPTFLQKQKYYLLKTWSRAARNRLIKLLHSCKCIWLLLLQLFLYGQSKCAAGVTIDTDRMTAWSIAACNWSVAVLRACNFIWLFCKTLPISANTFNSCVEQIHIPCYGLSITCSSEFTLECSTTAVAIFLVTCDITLSSYCLNNKKKIFQAEAKSHIRH